MPASGVPKKVDSIAALANAVAEFRDAGQTVVHCHGVFDLLHIGHIRYLQAAKRLGDVLVVTVTPDRFVNKGPHRPVFHESLRLDAIAALECVDRVALNDQPTAVEAIERLRPDVYAKGAEFRDRKTPELLQEEQAVAKAGGRVEFIEEYTSSSSRLINAHLSPFPPETEQYLTELRSRTTAEEILQPLDAARKLKVLVVGEAIVDEYFSCAVTGRSLKSPTIATKYESHARYPGGAVAVANHAAAFCDNVHLLAMAGDNDDEADWITEQLQPRITSTFHRKRNAPTIVKRRYHESYYQSTLFAVDFYDDSPMGEDESQELCDNLGRQLGEFDLIIVADYGHCFLDEAAVNILCKQSPQLAVTTQADPANFGMHTVSRYSRADYVCLSRQDLELDCRRRSSDVKAMLRDVAQRLNTTTATVTLGKAGALCYNESGDFHEAAGLSTTVVDRIGAGEAFFAVAALYAAAGASQEAIAFAGNVAGAEAVAVVGNSRPLERLSFERHVESLFK